jgi:hypothetical protein
VWFPRTRGFSWEGNAEHENVFKSGLGMDVVVRALGSDTFPAPEKQK